jgi:hypothetical protein
MFTHSFVTRGLPNVMFVGAGARGGDGSGRWPDGIGLGPRSLRVVGGDWIFSAGAGGGFGARGASLTGFRAGTGVAGGFVGS